MSSLSLLYSQKAKNGTGTKVNKTYIVPLSEIYIEPGYNIREIDQEHVNEFRDAFIAGEYVPALAVQSTDKGVKIVDGHHRYLGALAATEAGTEVVRLECKDFVGSESDRVAFMVTSSQGKPLTAPQRAEAYQRMLNLGSTVAEIAKKVKRSPDDVKSHLQLLSCGDGLLEMVKSGEVAHTTAVALSKEHGAHAPAIAQEKLEKAKASGKKKLTRSAAIPKFSAEKGRQMMARLEFANFITREEGNCILLPPEVDPMEVIALQNDYRQFMADQRTPEGEEE